MKEITVIQQNFSHLYEHTTQFEFQQLEKSQIFPPKRSSDIKTRGTRKENTQIFCFLIVNLQCSVFTIYSSCAHFQKEKQIRITRKKNTYSSTLLNIKYLNMTTKMNFAICNKCEHRKRGRTPRQNKQNNKSVALTCEQHHQQQY